MERARCCLWGSAGVVEVGVELMVGEEETMSSPRIGRRGEVDGEDIGDSSDEWSGLCTVRNCGPIWEAVLVVVVVVCVGEFEIAAAFGVGMGGVDVATVMRGSSVVRERKGDAKAPNSGGDGDSASGDFSSFWG